MTWEAGKPVVTLPIPGVPEATATATLDSKYMAERVVVKSGATTTEFTYSNYKDWNNPLNRVEAFYAGKMTERRNGAALRDLTTTETETRPSAAAIEPYPTAPTITRTTTTTAHTVTPLSPLRRRHGRNVAQATAARHCWPQKLTIATGFTRATLHVGQRQSHGQS